MLTHVSSPNSEGKVTYTFNNQSRVEVPKRYQVQGLVGRGAYGIVCSAVDSVTGDGVAIKKISNVLGDVVDGKRVLREVKFLSFFKHPNILTLKDLFRPSDQEIFDLYLVTELMSSDLQSILRSRSVRLTEVHCQYFTYQLLCALHHIHSANVIHRDLKPANLLTNSDCDLKLCDFGLARSKWPKMTHYVVTRWYRPPELLLACDEYDGAVDLWGVACLAVEMFTRSPLFPGRDYIHQLNLIRALLGLPDIARDFPHVHSPEALNYLRSLPPAERQSLEAVCPGVEREYRAAAAEGAEGDDDETEQRGEERGTGADNRGSDDGGDGDVDERYALFRQFVFGLLKYNPEERMTAREALAHPWLQGVREKFGGAGLEAEAGEMFFWEFDGVELDAERLRELMMNEITKRGHTIHQQEGE